MDWDSHCSDETICAWSYFRDIYVLRMEYPGVSSEFCTTRYSRPAIDCSVLQAIAT